MHAARRLFRLSAPVACALLVCAILELVGERTALAAGLASGSKPFWQWVPRAPLHSLGVDLTGVSFLFGYQEASLFWWHGLPSMQSDIDPPLWTISIELWGSLWILLLSGMRERSVWLYRLALCALIPMLGTGPMLLFTIGHICAVIADREGFIRISRIPGIGVLAFCMVSVGVVIGSGIQLAPPSTLPFLPEGIPKQVYMHWPVEVGSILIFVGIMLLPDLQSLLKNPLPRYLGRISFAIYLLHWPVMIAAGSAVFLATAPLGNPVAAMLAFAVGLALTLGLAAWFEHYIDAPVVRLSRRLKLPSLHRATEKPAAL